MELNSRKYRIICTRNEHIMATKKMTAALNIRAKGFSKLVISSAAEARAVEPALNEVEQSAEAGHGLPVEGIHAL